MAVFPGKLFHFKRQLISLLSSLGIFLIYFLMKNVFDPAWWCLSRSYFAACRSRDWFLTGSCDLIFVATNILSRQNILSLQTFCRDKHAFGAIKDVFCRDKHVFVEREKNFVATKIILLAASASDRKPDASALFASTRLLKQATFLPVPMFSPS